MTKEPSSPWELRVPANGLEHRLLEWRRDPSTGDASNTVFLVHGLRDAAGTWDGVAPRIASAGFRVLAPDMRGFGDGPRAPQGSYYHFADYIADLAGLIEHVSPKEPVAL